MSDCKRCGTCCRRNGLIPPFDPFTFADDEPLWLRLAVRNLRRHVAVEAMDYPCMFLTDHNTCMIHNEPWKPRICRKFPRTYWRNGAWHAANPDAYRGLETWLERDWPNVTQGQRAPSRKELFAYRQWMAGHCAYAEVRRERSALDALIEAAEDQLELSPTCAEVHGGADAPPADCTCIPCAVRAALAAAKGES